MHRAYLEPVPYEDVAVQLGETGRLDERRSPPACWHGRGGYCFELNTVLAALLRSVGFEVTHHQAVVGGEGPTNHMVLLVLLDGQTWIADAGLGEGFLDPLPLRAGSYTIGPFTYSLTREPRDLVDGPPRVGLVLGLPDGCWSLVVRLRTAPPAAR